MKCPTSISYSSKSVACFLATVTYLTRETKELEEWFYLIKWKTKEVIRRIFRKTFLATLYNTNKIEVTKQILLPKSFIKWLQCIKPLYITMRSLPWGKKSPAKHPIILRRQNMKIKSCWHFIIWLECYEKKIKTHITPIKQPH